MNVVIDLVPGQPADRMGHGYRVDVAVEIWSQEDVLTAPMTALFKQDRAWSVYRIEKGRARLRQVEVGHMNGQEAIFWWSTLQAVSRMACSCGPVKHCGPSRMARMKRSPKRFNCRLHGIRRSAGATS